VIWEAPRGTSLRTTGWTDKPTALLVNYQLPFAEKLLVIGLQKNTLSAKTFTHFTDDSHRTDYVERVLLQH